ncbi:MAG: DUF5005 domain-containing protein [Bacteroidaceae bacterium]|nr:DUF5005 domain-containing protein [Bacteroidaceae bacterium]
MNTKSSIRAALLSLLFFFPSLSGAQEIDLNEPLLEGLELDYRDKATSSSKVTIYDDLTWWTLFGMRQKGWNGGEGCYSTPLPDGNVFWSFGPSTFGRISEFRDRKKYNNTPCNTAMLQTATDENLLTDEDFITLNEYISTDPAKESSYYRGKTWIRHPDATLSESTINRGRTDTDHRYVPGDAHLLLRGGKPILQVVLHGVDEQNAYTDISIAEYSLDGTPGDEGYMQLIALHKDVVPFRVNYGMRLFEDDGHVYLYGTFTTGNRGYTWPVVARSTTLDLLDAWEYYIVDSNGNAQWQRQVPTMEEILLSAIAGTDRTEAPNIFRYEDSYYMVALNAPGGLLSIRQGPTPWGPFTKKKNLITMPSDEKVTKHLFLHPQLSRMGEIVCSYTMSPAEITIYTKKSDGSFLETVVSGNDRCYNAWGSANLNLPHFRRIFNWQTFYNISSREPLADAGLQSYEDMVNGIVPGELNERFDFGPSTRWQIVTPDGKQVSRGEGVPSTSSLPAGIYILVAETPAGHMSKKIVVTDDR